MLLLLQQKLVLLLIVVMLLLWLLRYLRLDEMEVVIAHISIFGTSTLWRR